MNRARSVIGGWGLLVGLVLMGLVVLGLLGSTDSHAGHDTEPVIVVPGRAGVPIIVDGQDVRGAVIEGDWGLARGRIGLTIIQPRGPIYFGYTGRSMYRSLGDVRFYPGTGRAPKRGRDEVIPPPNRPLPPKAESFHSGVKSESMPLPPDNPQPIYPMPPVGVGVDFDRNSRRHGPR
jgi:hypothetical protein